MSQREIAQKLNALGPQIVSRFMAEAALGDRDAAKALLPYVMPKMNRAAIPVSTAVEIDISTTDAAKASLQRIALAIGTQQIGMEEGALLLDVVGRALERISVVDIQDLTAQIEKLEAEQHKTSVGISSRQPISRANGSTPTWGNIVQHPSIVSVYPKVDSDGE
jgi:hypothetical protein